MTGWRGWASGRRLWLTGGLWLLALLSTYAWWWMRADWPWTPFDDKYSTVIAGIVPTLSGAIALYGILPGLDWVDLQAVTRPQLRDTAAATLIVVAFAALPPLIRWLLTLDAFYLRFVPENILAEPESPQWVAQFWGLGLETGFVIGATCLMTGLLGRLLGPLMGIVCYSGLLTIQGYRLMPLTFPRLGDVRSGLSLVAAALVVVLGLAAFRLSRSGARPLIGRMLP